VVTSRSPKLVQPAANLPARSFLVRYLTLFGGETFSKLCVVAAFAYLAHVLTPSDYGIVELALSITVFFVLGVESGMGLYGARVVAAEPGRIPSLVPQVMLLRVVLGVPAFAVILGVAAYYRVAGLGILAVNGIAVLLTPFLTQWVFQGLRQMQWVAAGTAIRNFTFVALVLALVRPGSDIRLVAAAEVCGITALALFNGHVLHRWLRVRLDWRGVIAGSRRLFDDVWYMGFSDFAWACLWYSPALVVGWLGLGLDSVAWIAASVRVVMAIHTFVWLYFFNMLPNLARELSVGVDDWRDLMTRSLAVSLWPAGLLAVGGTLIAPVLVPLVFGPAYVAAVRPLQVVVWMIPVAWFSGHFRFSLIAAGQQRWEFVASAGAAAVTLAASTSLAVWLGSLGAAIGLLAGGVANLVLSVAMSNGRVGSVAFGPSVLPALIATVVSALVGLAVLQAAGSFIGAIAGCAIHLALASRHQNELVTFVRSALRR
jgi:PST family polysaccharide transporter